MPLQNYGCPKYTLAIDLLIPEAEAEARATVTALGGVTSIPRPGREDLYKHDFFSHFYHDAMNRLAHNAGLRAMI